MMDTYKEILKLSKRVAKEDRCSLSDALLAVSRLAKDLGVAHIRSETFELAARRISPNNFTTNSKAEGELCKQLSKMLSDCGKRARL